MRKIVIYGIILFQIALIGSLVRGLQLSFKSRERLVAMNDTKNKLMQETEKLKREAEYVQSDYYVEKVAREELHLVKPGEKVVIMPEIEPSKIIEQGTSNIDDDRANWQKWWELIVRSNK